MSQGWEPESNFCGRVLSKTLDLGFDVIADTVSENENEEALRMNGIVNEFGIEHAVANDLATVWGTWLNERKESGIESGTGVDGGCASLASLIV